MKTTKTLVVMSLLALTTIFSACNSGGLTPELDTTNLWPAYFSALKKYGFINKNGDLVIQPMYDAVSTFSCGYARAQVGDNVYFINKKGELQQTTPVDFADDFYYNYCLINTDSKFGMMDKSLNIVVYPIYPDMGRMSAEGLVYVTLDGKSYGFIDKAGKTVIPSQFEEVNDFRDGVAVFRSGDKYGAINTKGSFAIMPMYDDLWSIGEKRLVMYDSNSRNCGMLTTSGDIKIQPSYKRIGTFFQNALAPFSMDGDNVGYIDPNGNMKIVPQYKTAYPFSGGYAVVYQGSSWMVINTKGEMQAYLPSEWGPAQQVFHNGLLLTTNGKEYRWIKPDGTVIFSWTDDATGLAPKRVPVQQNFRERITDQIELGFK